MITAPRRYVRDLADSESVYRALDAGCHLVELCSGELVTYERKKVAMPKTRGKQIPLLECLPEHFRSKLEVPNGGLLLEDQPRNAVLTDCAALVSTRD